MKRSEIICCTMGIIHILCAIAIFSQIKIYTYFAIILIDWWVTIGCLSIFISWTVFYMNKDLLISVFTEEKDEKLFTRYFWNCSKYCLLTTLFLFDYYILGSGYLLIIVSSIILRWKLRNDITFD